MSFLNIIENESCNLIGRYSGSFECSASNLMSLHNVINKKKHEYDISYSVRRI